MMAILRSFSIKGISRADLAPEKGADYTLVEPAGQGVFNHDKETFPAPQKRDLHHTLQALDIPWSVAPWFYAKISMAGCARDLGASGAM